MNQVKDPIINYLPDQTINWDHSNRKQKVRKAKTNSDFQIHSFTHSTKREGFKKVFFFRQIKKVIIGTR